MPNRPSKLYCYCPERHIDVNNKILKEFAKEVIKEICINPDGVSMPKPFGKILIGGVKNASTHYLDKGATNKYGKFIYHTNDETDGYLFRTVVRFRKHAFKLCFFYGIKPYKGIKNKIKQTIDQGNWQHWGQHKSVKDIK